MPVRCAMSSGVGSRALAIAVLVGCGEPSQLPPDSEQPIDASNVDVPASFACNPSTPAGPVLVHDVAAGVRVFVNDVNGTYLSMLTVPSNGDIQAMVPGCGSISLYPEIGGPLLMFTYVQPGDQIWQSSLHVPRDFSAGPVKLYIDTPVANTTSYTYSGPISGSATSPTEFNVGASPTEPTTIIVQPNAQVNSVSLPRSDLYAVVRDVMFSTSGPLHVTNWSASPPAHHFDVSLPAPAMDLSVALADEIRGHVYSPQRFDQATTGVSVTFDMQFPEVGTGAYVSLEGRLGPSSYFSFVRVFPVPLAATVAIDLRTELLPEVQGVNLTPAATRPMVSWSVNSGGVPPDLIVLNVRSDQGKRWAIVLPPGLTSFRLPELPAPYALSYNSALASIQQLETSNVDGYADARTSGAYYGQLVNPDGSTNRSSSFGPAF